MKITHVSNVDKFMKVVDECKGIVELITEEGDRLNLKSKLSQFVSIANIFLPGGGVKSEIGDLEIIAYEPEDAKRLIEYMVNGT